MERYTPTAAEQARVQREAEERLTAKEQPRNRHERRKAAALARRRAA